MNFSRLRGALDDFESDEASYEIFDYDDVKEEATESRLERLRVVLFETLKRLDWATAKIEEARYERLIRQVDQRARDSEAEKV